MNRILVILFFIAPSLSAVSQHQTLADFGVEISFSAGDQIFPEEWLTKEINGKATPMDSSEFERCRAVLLKALNKYPKELIAKHLTKIYVVDELEFYGQGYGGTNSISVVYLTNKGADLGYSDFWIEQAFHSEFSSIILRNFSFLFDKKKWTSINKGIEYGQGGTEALIQGKSSTDFDRELNEKGFLAEYATASLEEDFNMFAQNLFLSSPGFWQIGETQKRIAKKTSQIISFYHLIDNRFDEAYFRSISGK